MTKKQRDALAEQVAAQVKRRLISDDQVHPYDDVFFENEHMYPTSFESNVAELVFAHFVPDLATTISNALKDLSVKVERKDKDDLTAARAEIKELKGRLENYEKIEEIFEITKRV